MRGFELKKTLGDEFKKTGMGGASIVCIDEEGKTYSIKGVRTEIHTDAATGAATIWLEIEEN